MFHKLTISILALTLTITLSGIIVLKQEITKEKIEEVKQEQQLTEDTNNQNERQGDKDAEVLTSDIDTSNWKTYRNEEYGFEFKYPEEWILKERSGSVDLYSHNLNTDYYSVKSTPEGEYKIDISLPSLEQCNNKGEQYEQKLQDGEINNELLGSISNKYYYKHDYNGVKYYCIWYTNNLTLNMSGKLYKNYLDIYEIIFKSIVFDEL